MSSWPTFKAFGRGSDTSISSNFQDPYDELKTVSSAVLGQQMFHPNASIHEDFISWDRHNHEDGSLADGAIRFRHFNRTKSSADHSRVLFTPNPKTLILFGEFSVPDNLVYNDSNLEHSLFISFERTSFAGQSFILGTAPSVFASLKADITDMPTNKAKLFSYHITDISSSGFVFTFLALQDDKSGSHLDDMTVTYLAVGVAPGVLIPSGR